MTLFYKFKKEKLDDGTMVIRPRILVAIRGESTTIEVPALIDTGCDTTVIPEGIARIIGISLEGKHETLYAYREATEVVESKASITFIGKANRESVTCTIPVLIAISKQGIIDECDITLGISGIFDVFDITFKKTENKIICQKVTKIPRLG
ncbi:hypothetical protein HZA99_04940 [Candidatus Woesearchaeota archaeon]|nr:hypothetical protein [Candidatus Woesearchaeota archaeon]